MVQRSASLLICNGRVIDPASRLDAVVDVLLVDGRVASVGHQGAAPDGVDVFDASGCVVSPGFVDLHCHLRYPGFPDKETIASGSRAAAAGGFTTVCAMANTSPVVDSVDVLQSVLSEVERSSVVRVRQLGAVSTGLRGEVLVDLAALAGAGAVAFSDDGKPIWDRELMRAALRGSAVLDRVISVHEEDPDLVLGGTANAGPVARRLGLPEWPCAGEASLVARDIALLGETGGRLHIAHVSCRETVELLREARGRGLAVTAEVTPHHLCLTDELLEGDAARGFQAAHPCTKVNPPLRSGEDVDAVVGALADGIIDAVATDHAPHSAEDKAVPFDRAAFGISAIETALPLALDLVRGGILAMPSLIERLTTGPARVFGLAAGTLLPAAPADVCVFDPQLSWKVTPEALCSAGKNTPLLGNQAAGRVVLTVVDGRVVHRLNRI